MIGALWKRACRELPVMVPRIIKKLARAQSKAEFWTCQWLTSAEFPSLVSPNLWVNTLAKEKPAACQNHTLVTKKPTPRARRPTNDIANAVKVISHARQYAAPPCIHRRSARKGL